MGAGASALERVIDMWPFKAKPPPPPAKGQLQNDLAAMDLETGKIALMFEVPDENDSRYWIVDDPETLRALASGDLQVEPPDFFSNVNRIENADPHMPELVWLLEDRELSGAYNFTAPPSFALHARAEDFLRGLGAKARPVTWYEPHLNGKREIEALQDRLWGEDHLFALAELPDMSDVLHDFTHGFSLCFPPTDASSRDHGAVVTKINKLMEKAFPGSSDLYVLGRVHFEPVRAKTKLGMRQPTEKNAIKSVLIDGPADQLFVGRAQVLCEQAFFDHAHRNIRELMDVTALLSDGYLSKMKKLASALDLSQGTLTPAEQDLWLLPIASSFRMSSYPFRYFEWPA